MRLAHDRPGDTLERHNSAGWHVIEIVAALAESGPDGEPVRIVDYHPEDGGEMRRVHADTDPHDDWCRVDHEADARAGFAASAGAGMLLPAPPSGGPR